MKIAPLLVIPLILVSAGIYFITRSPALIDQGDSTDPPSRTLNEGVNDDVQKPALDAAVPHVAQSGDQSDDMVSPETTNTQNENTSYISNTSTTTPVERRDAELQQAFLKYGPQKLAERIEASISDAVTDEPWAATSNTIIETWFLENVDDPSKILNNECVTDVCYFDLSVSIDEMTQFYSRPARSWADSGVPGFLPTNFYIRADDNYFRVYLFRDTFEVSNL